MTVFSLADGVVLEPLDDACAVFVPSTSETHVVDVHGFALLQRLTTGSAHLTELADLLAHSAGIAVGDLPEEALDIRLGQWVDHGIVTWRHGDDR